MTFGARQVNIQLGVHCRALDRGGNDPLGLSWTVGGGVVWRVICRTSDRETTPGLCNMHKGFAGGRVPPSATLDGADNRTQITFTQGAHSPA
ncbi:BZ3500_MvSof-1268-A1-R1_Chr1-2g01483 [Microbotryum saponariae]|uniref:BZ3500_MvSof-1268-A1-R1_Chr1-2g01483 protein n=1 Tax=Microbotryum saponariae TaxID=289078 RepID=A0A2X0LF57_9BASI|nr:BZ3500_MvSof-1268-A1-R1_Chr1-2g01483 [Microbotryum saponariae]SCZ97491.1 BZ3501_MvSof-1269-A2-R1_Chr1-2g01082 [Microbotryum saponariae]